MAKHENRICIYCNKEYTPRTGNQKTCGAEECQIKLRDRNSALAKIRNKERIIKRKPKRTVKDKSVCKGCKYVIPQNYTFNDLRGACDYAEMTGQSRLKIELENGGFRTDYCPCYKKGERERRKVYPI